MISPSSGNILYNIPFFVGYYAIIVVISYYWCMIFGWSLILGPSCARIPFHRHGPVPSPRGLVGCGVMCPPRCLPEWSAPGGADAAGLGEEVGEDAWIYSDEDEGDWWRWMMEMDEDEDEEWGMRMRMRNEEWGWGWGWGRGGWGWGWWGSGIMCNDGVRPVSSGVMNFKNHNPWGTVSKNTFSSWGSCGFITLYSIKTTPTWDLGGMDVGWFN